ncbi:hypothetical protein Tsubulata_027417, partial [Turnera subulata]
MVEIEPGTVMRFWAPTQNTNITNRAKNEPGKQAVVFLHGLGLDGILTWHLQVLALAKTYPVYVPDFLFFGGSFTDKTDRSVDFQAECVAIGLRKLGVEKCTVVGLSYGGLVGFKMAEMYPDLVESMVVTCAAMAFTESIRSGMKERLGVSSLPEHLIPETVQGVKDLFKFATYKSPRMPDFLYKDILEMSSENRKQKVELMEALVVRDEDFKIPHYPQRIHLLWGEHDILYNLETAHSLKEQLGGKATLHYIEKAGHLVQTEQPGAYNRQLKKILASWDEARKQDLRMVRISTIYVHLLHALMKLVGLRPQAVQIEKGTIIHFWVPHRKPTNQEKAINEPEKPSVVFLHGFALDGILTWQFQAMALAKKYAVYIPNFLFFGGSTTDRADRSMAFQVECMANGLKKLGVSKCTLVGFSYGGFACFKMAEMYPDLVHSLVVSGSAMAFTNSVSLDILQGIGFSSFAEFLLPRTIKGIKELLEVGSYKWPWIPDCVYTDFLE